MVVVVTDRLTSESAKRCRPQQVRLVGPAVGAWLVLALLACLAVDTANAANCDVASGAAAISACEKELARNPTSIEVRLRYADVLMGQQQYQKASNILKDTLAMRPGSETIKQKYRLASSLAEEQQSIKQQSDDTPAAGTRNSVKEILCKTLKGQRAINACDEVLTTDPRNVTALTRRGDELMALNQVVDAVVSYRRAVALDPANPILQNKLTRAESKMPPKPLVDVAKAPATATTPKITTATPSKSKEQTPVDQPTPGSELQPTDRSAIATLQPVEQITTQLTPDTTAVDGDQPETTKLRISAPEIIRHYSNASLTNGSTY